MRGSGGTDGGLPQFFIGLGLAVLSLYLFFDSVHVTTGGNGWVSGSLREMGRGPVWETSSMGIVFVPFFLGVFALFYDAKKQWAWWLAGIGLAILVVEILSRIRFAMDMKSTFLLILIVLFAAGTALMFRSYRQANAAAPATVKQPPPDAK